MAVQNGAVDGILLFPAAGSSGARLRFGTAYRWGQVRNEVHRRYGWWPEVTSAGDGYRDLATQVRIFLQRYSLSDSGWRGPGHIKSYQGRTYYIRTNPLTGGAYAVAATPGTSNHGYAKAVDVSGLSSMVLTRWVQFSDVATEFGLSNAEGYSIREAWHWVDTRDPDVAVSGTAPTTPTEEDDDMFSDQDRAVLGKVYEWLQGVQPTIATGIPALQRDIDQLEALLGTSDAGALHRILAASEQVNAKADNIARGVATILTDGGGDVDEAAIAAAVIASLTPEKIAAAIPDAFAQQVADVLAARLAH